MHTMIDDLLFSTAQASIPSGEDAKNKLKTVTTSYTEKENVVNSSTKVLALDPNKSNRKRPFGMNFKQKII